MEELKGKLLEQQKSIKKALLKFHEYALSENMDVAKSAEAKIKVFEKELKLVRKDLADLN